MNNIVITISLFYCVAIKATDLKNKEIGCGTLKEKFGNASAQFTLCSIDKSRPITICEKCADTYIDVLNSYQNMSKEMVNGTSCLDKFINQDRLQILKILYDNSVNLWTEAKCFECHESFGTQPPTVSNKTKQFQTYADISNCTVTKCYESFGTQPSTVSNKTKQFQTYYAEFSNCTVTNEDINLCSNCMKDYIALDNYFKSISNINERIGVCMDLVDIMNTTWTFWSNNCCRYRRHNEYIFIGSSVGVLVLTVLFYFIIQFYKEKNAPTIIQQSRFFGSLDIFRD